MGIGIFWHDILFLYFGIPFIPFGVTHCWPLLGWRTIVPFCYDILLYNLVWHTIVPFGVTHCWYLLIWHTTGPYCYDILLYILVWYIVYFGVTIHLFKVSILTLLTGVILYTFTSIDSCVHAGVQSTVYYALVLLSHFLYHFYPLSQYHLPHTFGGVANINTISHGKHTY